MIYLLSLLLLPTPQLITSDSLTCYYQVNLEDPNLNQYINGAQISAALPEALHGKY